MASEASHAPVRISKIADRYLVFDAEDVAVIRRSHNMCSVLVGTTPQNPTQNVFLSLPLELLPEEASVLVEKKVGRLVDETSHHLSTLRSTDKSTRQEYIGLLKDRRNQAQKLVSEEQAKKVTEQARRAADAKSTSATKLGDQGPATTSTQDKSLTVTLTTSGGLESSATETMPVLPQPPLGPLHQHLQSKGYFMTPGLRFGADYSVYPGDPLRYHAHFLATNYEWDEKIPMLDVVGSGRLGTSVKKGFLLGGEVAAAEDATTKEVRTFCVEWAGM
ncbi:tRNA intron endonuclease [Colletotrichum karsti]|uniref:tRNA-splicing endonuclease subunit Sen34 n=1 Tax=Colletotrichum karsti TaxID=1095194 RepID=A0A9P6HRT3_9PEZI|nr:tRNA intron endonuclease [Colletotrichum karsti]KAF9869217.1 tRNA intron endonuclease [Colletotrichum karsti]